MDTAAPIQPDNAIPTQPTAPLPPPPPNKPLPRKRRKISNACEPCRSRKIRCDGGWPLCGPCSNRGRGQHMCVYKNTKSQDTIDPHMTSLVDRIQVLERAVASSSGNASSEPGISQRDQDTATPSIEAGRPKPNSPRLHRHRVSFSTESELISARSTVPSDFSRLSQAPGNNEWLRETPIDIPNTENQPSPVNAMGATSYVSSRGASPSNEFYGGSSAAHFMCQVKETIPRPISENDRTRPSRLKSNGAKTSSPGSGSYDFSASALPENLSLPTRDLADMLLDKYWTKAHSLYPFIHKPSFVSAYENLWMPSNELHKSSGDQDLGLGSSGISDSRSTVFHCALNAIFALGCQLADAESSIQNRESLSETFFLRSKALLHVDILDHGSIAIVQTLLIVAQYLQSTSFPSRCWTALGLACRIGQGLGLHVEDCHIPREPHDFEIRRRVWYGCVILDIVASMTLGRPMMTPYQRTIPIPSPTPVDEFFDLNGEKLPKVMFYVETINLYLILGKILSNVYKPWSGQGDSDRSGTTTPQKKDLEVVMSLDEEMSTFEDNMTSWLHWGRGASTRDSLQKKEQMVLQRQTNVLHARYLHIQILLHRPTFLRFCRELESEKSRSTSLEPFLYRGWNLRSKIDMQSSAACIGAAVDLANLLDDATRTECDGAWWYTTFYLCTAAMVLILAESCTKMHQHFDVAEVHRAWLLCCDILRHIVRKGHPANNALTGLCKMYQRLVLEFASAKVNEAGQSEIHNSSQHQISNLGGSPFQEQYRTGLEDKAGDDSGQASANPLMDFMTQDMDLMPFGLLDESWWRQQHGDMNLGMKE